MRIGMIGTGGVARQHLAALSNVAGAEIVAVSGRDASKAEAIVKPRAGAEVECIPAVTDAFQRQATAFLAAVATGDPSLLPRSFADGVATLRLTRAIDAAAVSGQPVRI